MTALPERLLAEADQNAAAAPLLREAETKLKDMERDMLLMAAALRQVEPGSALLASIIGLGDVPTEPLKLAFEYDNAADVITIEGIRYHGGVFRDLSVLPVGTVVRISAREEGVLTLTRENEVGYTRDCYDRLHRTLTSIHALLYPKQAIVDGNVIKFESPILHEQFQALSDLIRAIPQEREHIDAGSAYGNT